MNDYKHLKTVVLGCSGIYSAPGGACSGYLIDSEDTVVWLEAGPGSLSNLQLHQQLEEIDAIVLSHEHPDHWLELPVIYNALKYCVDLKPLKVYGTAGTKVLAESIIGQPLTEEILDFVTITDGQKVEIGNQKWQFAQTDHPVETLAARINFNGSSMGYSADTGPNWDSSPISSEVDLFLCEATFSNELEEDGAVHLSARQAGELAKQGGAKRLVITHKMPEHNSEELAEQASEAFGATVEQAEVNAVYVI